MASGPKAKNETKQKKRPARAARPANETVAIGWQKLRVRVPADWHIGALGGDVREGYLRLDDGDMPRLETKWQTATGYTSVKGVVTQYLDELRKKAEKGKRTIKVKRDTRILSRRKKRKASLECFSWTEEQEAHGAAWYCDRCNRVVIAQVIGALGSNVRPIAAEVLTSLEDHPSDEWALWAAYDLEAYVPEDFELADQKLMAGLLELSFTRELEKAAIFRWGMANVMLRDISLLDWAKREIAPRYKRLCRCKADEVELRGHPGVLAHGTKDLFPFRVARFVTHCRHKSYPDTIRCYIWHCEETNKVYAVETHTDALDPDLGAEMLDRLRCH